MICLLGLFAFLYTVGLSILKNGINILHTEASDGWGGQEIRILDEMLGMRGRGHGVMLAAPGHSRIYGRALKEGIPSFRIDMTKGGFVADVFRLARIIRNKGVSIINTHSSRDSWIGSIAGRMSGVPVIRTRHISSDLKGSKLTRLVYNRLADAIITTGNFVKDKLVSDVGVDPGRVYPIPTGVDAERYADGDGSVVREELGIALDETVLGVAAVLRSWKGHHYLVKAMPEILAGFPRTRLVLAGEGPMRESIVDLVRDLGLGDRVMLAGHREDIANVVQAFDISLLVSYASEGVPQFLLQSMAAGKPVIGARTGGIPEVIKDGVNGILVEPKNPAEIAGTVKAMLNDRDMMVRMGAAGRAMVAENFTREGMLDKLEALYARLLG